MQKIYIAADHAGYPLKQSIIHFLESRALLYSDLGTSNEQSVDYPIFARKVRRAILEDPQAVGILVCGTGIGMSIMANRYPGIRAAVCNDGERSAYFARLHNNANILCLGARLLSAQQALPIVETFLHTPFEGGRHQMRIDLIDQDNHC
jgi:ribose 5-phosphate isomerase B